jgi:hypothetical protein
MKSTESIATANIKTAYINMLYWELERLTNKNIKINTSFYASIDVYSKYSSQMLMKKELRTGLLGYIKECKGLRDEEFEFLRVELLTYEMLDESRFITVASPIKKIKIEEAIESKVVVSEPKGVKLDENGEEIIVKLGVKLKNSQFNNKISDLISTKVKFAVYESAFVQRKENKSEIILNKIKKK